MSDPKRLMAYYCAVVENALGLEARVTEDAGALVFQDEELTYVIHNTSSFDPGLIDMTVCVPSTDDPEIKEQVCLALDVPCLRAWVDDDGDIVINVQSHAAGAHLIPRLEVLREVLPRLLHVLHCAVVRVNQDCILAGIARASG